MDSYERMQRIRKFWYYTGEVALVIFLAVLCAGLYVAANGTLTENELYIGFVALVAVSAVLSGIR